MVKAVPLDQEVASWLICDHGVPAPLPVRHVQAIPDASVALPALRVSQTGAHGRTAGTRLRYRSSRLGRHNHGI
jgi:hypothetical protein